MEYKSLQQNIRKLNLCMLHAWLLHDCVLVMANSLQPYGLKPTRLLCPQDSPGKNNGVGCHAPFQGIFLTQGSNPPL